VEAERLFCSEYAYWCYGKSGILPSDWQEKDSPTPGDMLSLGLFKDPVLIKE